MFLKQYLRTLLLLQWGEGEIDSDSMKLVLSLWSLRFIIKKYAIWVIREAFLATGLGVGLGK